MIVDCYLTLIKAKFQFWLLIKIPSFGRLLLVKMLWNLFMGLLLRNAVFLAFLIVENDLTVFLFAVNSTWTI
jgi:hypothetical protein